MIKFIKNIFSFENLKRAMMYSAFTQANLTTSDYINLINVLKNDHNNSDKTMQLKKVI